MHKTKQLLNTVQAVIPIKVKLIVKKLTKKIHISYCKVLLQLKPNDPGLNNFLASALQNEGDLSGAIASYNVLLQLTPNDPELHNALGNVLKNQGDLASAIAAYNKALELNRYFAWTRSIQIDKQVHICDEAEVSISASGMDDLRSEVNFIDSPALCMPEDSSDPNTLGAHANCIFICVFNQVQYVEMLLLLLESIHLYGNLSDRIHILIYTSSLFKELISSSCFLEVELKFEINDTYNDVDKACKARLDLFKLPSVKHYKKVLYLDTDVLIKDDMQSLFDVCEEDILYVLEEGSIDSEHDYWGRSLFKDEIAVYDDKTAFSSGIILFNNCKKIEDLFDRIREDIHERPFYLSCHDQPYIVYNAFKYRLFDNKTLKALAVNNNFDIDGDKVIHHFPGHPGVHQQKALYMTNFLIALKKNYQGDPGKPIPSAQK